MRFFIPQMIEKIDSFAEKPPNRRNLRRFPEFFVVIYIK